MFSSIGIRRPVWGLLFCSWLLLFLLLSGGCGNDNGEAENTATTFTSLFWGADADYDPETTPDGLADRSDLVVAGEIQDVVNGRWSPDPDFADERFNTAVFHVRVDEVLAGDPGLLTDGMVYFEYQTPWDASVYLDALPSDRSLVVYLRAIDPSATMVDGIEINDPDQGRPLNVPLFAPVNPQALLIPDPAGVVEPLNKVVLPGIELSDVYPDAPTDLTNEERLSVSPPDELLGGN